MVLFDLDGTLVDTAHDLGRALNIQLELYGKPSLSHDKIWPVASHGSKGLLELGFGITPEDENFEAMKTQYLDLYEEVFQLNPIFLPDIEGLLNALDEKNIRWGIVTNKPRRFSLDLIKAVKMQHGTLYERSACLVCGDDAPQPKPSPETLLMACEQTKSNPKDCIYVGDAQRDVQAGRAAGMKTVVALFGYIAETDKPETWGADFEIKTPKELLNFI